MSILICFFNQEPVLSLRTGLTSLFGLSNLYLLKQSTDYFAQSTEFNVFTHTWSLGVEEQFYILFPFLIWFSGFGRQTNNGARNLFLLVGVLTISSLIGFFYLYPINQSAAYFLMPTRFWEMASGCLLFIFSQKGKSIKRSLSKFPPFLAIALIIGVMYLPKSLATTSTIAVVVLSSILIASLKEKTKAYKFFTNSKLVYVGLISYSLYLWHWGILSISRWTIGIHWWSVPFQLALMFGFAIASYQYIETPLRKGSWFGKRWKTIFIGGAAIITLSCSLIALDIPLKGQLFTGKKIYTAQPPFLEGEDCSKNISANIACLFIDNKRDPDTLWMLGDSHTSVLALAGEEVANSIGMNLKLYSVPGTSFPPVRKYRKGLKKQDLQLFENFRLIEKNLHQQMKNGDVILLSMRMPYHFGGIYYNPEKDYRFYREDGSYISRENNFNEWISSVVNLADIAKKKGTKVIVQTPTPEWEKELNKLCSTKNNHWFNRLQKINCEINSKFFVDQETGLYKHLFEKLNQLSTSHKNIYLFDTYKVLCPDEICSFTKNGVDIYADDDHISNQWARDFLAPEFYEFIKIIKD